MSNSFNHLSDEQLMMAYADGNNAAFETLYLRHESAMLSFIRRTLGQALSSYAEEVYQDVWLRIITFRNGYIPPKEGGASWKTWAFTIAHNAAIDRVRTQSKFVTIEPVDDNDDPMEWIQASLDMTHPSAEDKAFWQAAGAQLLECLESLPTEQRAAFLLHHQEDSSLEAMAQLLETPFETVKSRLRYAMLKLRKCMHAYLKEFGGAL
ncbi:MAG: sigma-70 family RNA polymerase sigma factor [Saezia sp.]